jgi:hypothetical protein
MYLGRKGLLSVARAAMSDDLCEENMFKRSWDDTAGWAPDEIVQLRAYSMDPGFGKTLTLKSKGRYAWLRNASVFPVLNTYLQSLQDDLLAQNVQSSSTLACTGIRQ